jgi:cytochrome c oxidase subunit 3
MSDAVIRRPLPVGSIRTLSPGWLGMIFVVFSEGSLFVHLLFSYYYLSVQPHLGVQWPPGGAPALRLALPNTIILLLSSVAVWWAQRGIRRGSVLTLNWGLGIGIALGIVFLGIQSLEWSNKTFTLATDVYSSIYYTTTGFHMAHVAVGIIVLAALLVWSALGYFNRVRNAYIHIGALYWHFVDAVWVFVFATVYLSPRLV